MLLTQIDVFEDGCSSDSEQMESEGVDLQNHEELFHVVYERGKVLSVYQWKLSYL